MGSGTFTPRDCCPHRLLPLPAGAVVLQDPRCNQTAAIPNLSCSGLAKLTCEFPACFVLAFSHPPAAPGKEKGFITCSDRAAWLSSIPGTEIFILRLPRALPFTAHY